MPLGDTTVLGFIIERLCRVVKPENILIATSDGSTDDVIAAYAKKIGIDCFRGSLNNVALRFYEAAASKGWKYATRINGDNIFVDLPLLKTMLAIAAENKYDFISNVKGRTYPKGMSIEIIRVDFYAQQLHHIQQSAYHSEHVTSYIYENEGLGEYHFQYNTEMAELAGIQLALDTPEDLQRTRNIVTSFKKPQYMYGMAEINEILKKINE